MDPPKPESPASMALEPSGTRPTHAAVVDNATRSSSIVGPFVKPELSVSSEDVSSGAVPGGQRRASLADDTTPRFSAADPSLDVARNEAAPSLNVMTTASDVSSPTVPGGQRQVPLTDDANRLSATVARDASAELVHNQAVPSNSNVPSEAAINLGGSLAKASITDAPVELARNQAAPFESMAGPARRGSSIHSERSVPRRASVQVVDDVSVSSLAYSVVEPPAVQAVPSIESSIGLRSAAGVVQQRRASAATDASLLSSPLDYVADTSHNQAVPSGAWPTDLGPSSHSAASHHVLVADDAAPSTGRSGHVAAVVTQVKQPDDVFSKHVEGSGPLSSASRRASLVALAGISQSMHIAAGAAASLDSPHTLRPIQSLSGDCSSNEHHVNARSSIAAEASSQVDAGLMHEVGIAACRLQEAAASLTNVAASLAEAAALLSKVGVVSLAPLQEQPRGVGAQSTSASALPTDVGQTEDSPPQAVHNGEGQAQTDVQNPSRAQDTPEVKPDPVLVAALTTAMGEPTGWAAIEKAMTNYDREEIGGYKEDIDSLLTFTGLYSAVLTAFVIVSYPLLQEDTPGESLQVLRVIANQTSTSMPAMQFSPFLSSSPFQPSSAAIRINILWFASLVISLATASFAILVKQWLRSYLKFATASPQGQLRIRHFRHAGLEAWKVFGIASTLPLLLQVSLALFFAGLCIFTLDVHPTIGHTTLPLVCAWLFLFTVVTVSPSFTARCPYNTPALQGYTYTLRCHIYPVFVTMFMKYICFGAFMGVALMLFPILCASMWLEEKYSTSKIMEHVVHSIGTVWEYLEGYQSSKPAEEAGMINNTKYDLEILASADALQADDRLLGTTIKSALEQSDANWVQLLEFALQIIGNRIPVVDSETNLEHILSAYRSLSPSVREVIDEIFQSHIKSKAVKARDDSIILPSNRNTLARWTFCILAQGDMSVVAQDTGVLKESHLAQMLYQAAGFGYKLNILEQVTDSSLLWLVILCLLQHHKGSDDVEKKLLMYGLKLEFSDLCCVLGAVYTDKDDIPHWSNIIHSIVRLRNSSFSNLKTIEVLKLSLLSVRVMYGKIHDNQDSKPNWSSNEAAQWKRTFIWLADRLWHFWVPSFSTLSPDKLALRQLARSGWGEIPDPTEDSSQEALPLPDYFSLMLWWAAGEDLSQIPSQHSQLLRIAHMSSDEQLAIWAKGWAMAAAYLENPANLYPPGTEDDDDEVGGIGASPPPQNTQDSITNGSKVDADELVVSEGSQAELHTNFSAVSPSAPRPPSEAEGSSANTAEQYSRTDSEPAGGTQPEQTPSPMHETIHSTEDTELSPGERRDGSHDGDGPKKLQPAERSTQLAEEAEDLAGVAAHQASEEGGATPSIAGGCTAAMSLPITIPECNEVESSQYDVLHLRRL